LTYGLIIVTFDKDLRDKVLRGRCRCLHIRSPERTARQRLAAAYERILALLQNPRCELVTLTRDGAASTRLTRAADDVA
jgi:hypothetical protein